MVSQMSPRKRLLTTIKYEEPDRVPVAPRIWAWFLKYYGEADWRIYLRAQKEFDFDPIICISPGIRDYIHSGPIEDNCAQLEDVSLEQDVTDQGDVKIVKKKFITPTGILTDDKLVPKPGKGYGISPNPENREFLLKSPEEVREAVAEAIKIGAPGGGFILSTCDSIRDETPLENVRAYFQANREFGKYSIS